MLSKLLSSRGRRIERQPTVNEPGTSAMATSFFDSSKSATLKDTTITSHAAANGGLLLNLHVSRQSQCQSEVGTLANNADHWMSEHSHSDRPSLPSKEQPRSEDGEISGIGLSSPLPHQEMVGSSLSKAPIKQKTRAQVYFDSLLPEGRGSPLYTPAPGLHLPKEYRRSGVRPGDVVIINQYGATSYLFNIFASADDPINIGRVPASFSPLPESLAKTEIYPQCAGVVTSSSVQTSASGLGYETSREGALVAMPLGVTSMTLANSKALKKYLKKELESWYDYVLSDGRSVENGDIRLVTGCDKTSMWGMATFLSEERTGGQVKFLTDEDCRSGARYTHQCSGSASAQTGPLSAEIQDLRDPGSDELIVNQCLFLQTMNPSLPDPVFEEISLRVEAEGYNGWDFAPEPTEGSSSSQSSTTATSNSARVRFDSTPNASISHPSSGVNKLLLQKYPKAKFVITEDIHWMSVVSKTEPFPSVEELVTRMESMFDLAEDDGVITFELRTTSPPSTTFPPPFLTDPCKQRSATGVESQYTIDLLQRRLPLLRTLGHLDLSLDLKQHLSGIQLELMSRRLWIVSVSDTNRHEVPSNKPTGLILDAPLQHDVVLDFLCRSQPIIRHPSKLEQIVYAYAGVCWSIYVGRDLFSIMKSPEDDTCEEQCKELILWSNSPARSLPYDPRKEYDRRQRSEENRLCDIVGDRPGLSETIAPDDGRGRPPFKHTKDLSDHPGVPRTSTIRRLLIESTSEDTAPLHVSTSTTDRCGTHILHRSTVRPRTTIVCAECRRLKLKCDRRAPCGSCSKRNVASRCQYPTDGTEKVDGGILPFTNMLSTFGRLGEAYSTLSTDWVECLPIMGVTTSSGGPFFAPWDYRPEPPRLSRPIPRPPRNLDAPWWQASGRFTSTESPVLPYPVWASPLHVPFLSSKLYPWKQVGNSVESQADKSTVRLCQDVAKNPDTLELSDFETREDASRLLRPTGFDLTTTEGLSWTSQDLRDSQLFNSYGIQYRFETSTSPSTGASVTVLSRSMGTQMSRIAKIEWGGGRHGLGRIILGKVIKFESDDFLRQDPDRASRVFTGSDGVCYRWRGSESNRDVHLVDLLGTVISIYHPIKPTRYQQGTVYGELHFFPDPVTKNPVDQPMKDMVVLTAMLSRFRDAFEL